METPEVIDKTTVALLNLNVGNIQRDISDIKISLKELNSIFASKEQLIQIAKDTENRLVRLESSSNLLKWLLPIVSAILGSVVTILIISYLNNLK